MFRLLEDFLRWQLGIDQIGSKGKQYRGLMVNGIFHTSADWASKTQRWMRSWPSGTTSVLPHTTTDLVQSTTIHLIPTTLLIIPSQAEGHMEEIRSARQETTGVVWMRAPWRKHTDILQGQQKKCPLEQWQRSAGQRRRGWPWQITNKRIDKTSLARQKPPRKSIVSRKIPSERNTAILLVCLFS